jgi:dipeptidyl aminopeptidase/acylaminoacyl peptidase
LVLFSVLVGILAYVVINATLAWTYIYFLAHPTCQVKPETLPNMPAPEEHWLKTYDNLDLRAWYYPARNGVAIIALGGMGGALGDNLPQVDFLIDEGFGVLQIDSRACARPRAPVTLGAKETFDAEAGLDFLLSRPEVKEVGVFGFSMGAAAAVRAAAAREEIAAVVAEGGYFNLGDDFIEPASQMTILRKAFLYSIAASYWLQAGMNPWQISPIDELPKISPRPVFLIYGEGEAASGRAQAQLNSAREPKELWVVPGGAHGSNYAAAPGEYRQRVTEFFNKMLDQ